jgi:hypothetical protein
MQTKEANMARKGFEAIAIALGLAAALGTAAASADTNDRAATDTEKAEVRTKLEGLGYREVHDIEVDDGLIEADAISPGGHKVDVQLELGTLEIVGESRD